MRHKSLFFLFFFTAWFTASCSQLKKTEDSPIIEGAEAEDISTDNMNAFAKDSDSGTLEGLSTVYFALDSSLLTESVKETLAGNKEWLDNNPSVQSVILEGHCDASGSEAYNIGLGERRAQSVFNYLKSLGVSESKMSLISYGEEKPLSPSDYGRNRRVNFVPQY